MGTTDVTRFASARVHLAKIPRPPGLKAKPIWAVFGRSTRFQQPTFDSLWVIRILPEEKARKWWLHEKHLLRQCELKNLFPVPPSQG